MASQHVLGLLLTALFLAPTACGEEVLGEVVVQLRTPSSPDPFQGVVKVRLRATGQGMAEVTRDVERSADAVALPPLPYGEGRVITVEGLDQGGAVLSHGTSAAFSLTAQHPDSVQVFFARRERFSLIKARLSTARYDHTASTLSDGRVVIAGGSTSGASNTASVEIYDPGAGTLTGGPALKHGRAGHAAAVVGDTVVIVAGHGAPGSVELYDAESGTTAELTLSTPRTGHTATALKDGSVLVVGGVDDKGNVVDTVEIIDPQKKQIRAGASAGPGLVFHVAVALNDGRVLLAGGRKPPGGKITDEAKLFTPGGAGSWKNAVKLPAGRARAVAVRQASGEVLIVGGDEETGPTREALIFEGKTFKKSAQTSVVHLNHAMTPLVSATLVAGGTGTRRVELFSSGAFRDVGELVRQREQFTLTTLPDGSALAVGGLAGSALADVEIFVP
jgi:hypothetical protein